MTLFDESMARSSRCHMVHLTVPSLVWVGGCEIIHGLMQLQCAPVYAGVRSDLTSLVPLQFSYLLQGRESGTRIFFNKGVR